MDSDPVVVWDILAISAHSVSRTILSCGLELKSLGVVAGAIATRLDLISSCLVSDHRGNLIDHDVEQAAAKAHDSFTPNLHST
jgi:hypothetical protein